MWKVEIGFAISYLMVVFFRKGEAWSPKRLGRLDNSEFFEGCDFFASKVIAMAVSTRIDVLSRNFVRICSI